MGGRKGETVRRSRVNFPNASGRLNLVTKMEWRNSQIEEVREMRYCLQEWDIVYKNEILFAKMYLTLLFKELWTHKLLWLVDLCVHLFMVDLQRFYTKKRKHYLIGVWSLSTKCATLLNIAKTSTTVDTKCFESSTMVARVLVPDVFASRPHVSAKNNSFAYSSGWVKPPLNLLSQNDKVPFVGLCYLPQFWGEKPTATTKVTLASHQI